MYWRGAEDAVLFFVPSEPAGSKDYSPPGQVDDETTPILRRRPYLPAGGSQTGMARRLG